MSDLAKWYVAHTYSGYENNVKANIEKIIENRGMENLIFEIQVPVSEVTELKNGVKKVKTKKIFPGYVFIKMIMNDDTWYVVRNTRGVTSFVGPGSKPVPLTENEILNMGIETSSITIDINVGDTVNITSGLFEGQTSIVLDVNQKRKTVTLNMEVFGRQTPTELDFSQVKKM